jgi:hypothetical protein
MQSDVCCSTPCTGRIWASLCPCSSAGGSAKLRTAIGGWLSCMQSSRRLLWLACRTRRRRQVCPAERARSRVPCLHWAPVTYGLASAHCSRGAARSTPGCGGSCSCRGKEYSAPRSAGARGAVLCAQRPRCGVHTLLAHRSPLAQAKNAQAAAAEAEARSSEGQQSSTVRLGRLLSGTVGPESRAEVHSVHSSCSYHCCGARTPQAARQQATAHAAAAIAEAQRQAAGARGTAPGGSAAGSGADAAAQKQAWLGRLQVRAALRSRARRPVRTRVALGLGLDEAGWRRG